MQFWTFTCAAAVTDSGWFVLFVLSVALEGDNFACTLAYQLRAVLLQERRHNIRMPHQRTKHKAMTLKQKYAEVLIRYSHIFVSKYI